MCCVFPAAGSNLAHEAGAPVRRRSVRRLRGGGDPADHQPAAGAGAHGDAGGGLRARRQRRTAAVGCRPRCPISSVNVLTERLGLVPGQVRVIAPDVGGGFGGKISARCRVTVLCWAVRRLGRAGALDGDPQRLHARHEPRPGPSPARHHRRPPRRHAAGVPARYPGRRRGLSPRRLAARGDVWMAGGAYAIPKVDARARTVVTNTTPVNAYRGAGRPEATGAIERAVDLFAAEIGMDPADVRRKNLLRPEAFPYTTPTGMEYDSGDYPAALEEVLAAADYPALRAEQARRRAAGDHLLYGIGLASYVEITGLAAEEHGRITMNADGSVTADVGSSAQGQGHADHLRNDHRRPARRADGPHHHPPHRHRRSRPRGRHIRLAIAATGRLRPARGERAVVRRDAAARRGRARRRRGRRRARSRHRALAGPGRPVPADQLGRPGEPVPTQRFVRRRRQSTRRSSRSPMAATWRW